ncbi:MAG: energy-coupling factor transporter transmembrane protein EcfT [Lachnospiraceae bacterium]|nr:energy-coupling factor transporter transmembrane protein EcfT [Lachnospiraceae bacterium]
MIRDITIGQYYPVDSVIHRLDPRVKLFTTVIFIISLFIKKNIVLYMGATIFLITVIILSKVPLRYILKGLKPIVFLLIFTCVMNLFFSRGETVLFSYKIFVISKEGIYSASFLAIRLIELVIGSALLTYTTTPTKLTDGIEKGLGFLRVFKIPVHEFAMMMSIALRFIPILMEELDKIMKAQEARCATFNEGNFINRAKAMVPILIPLFVAAIRRANDLALAMESRCYQGGEGRTKLHPLKYKARDRIAYFITFAYLAAMIGLRMIVSA